MFLHYWPFLLAACPRPTHILCCISNLWQCAQWKGISYFGISWEFDAAPRHLVEMAAGERGEIDSPRYITSLNQSAIFQRSATRRELRVLTKSTRMRFTSPGYRWNAREAQKRDFQHTFSISELRSPSNLYDYYDRNVRGVLYDARTERVRE